MTCTADTLTPFSKLLDRITQLPELNLNVQEVKVFFTHLDSLLYKNPFLTQKEFAHEAIKTTKNLPIPHNISDQANRYFELLADDYFFNYFQAINSAITYAWEQVHIFGKAIDGQHYLGADEMLYLLRDLLPNEIGELKIVLTRLQILEKLGKLQGENNYSIVLLETAIINKINNSQNKELNVDVKQEKRTKSVLEFIRNAEFTELVNTYTTLRPIKVLCQEYKVYLHESINQALMNHADLYKRFKLNEAIGQTCLLDIENLLKAYDQGNPALQHFSAHNTKFRVCIKKYKALMVATKKLQEPNPMQALIGFRDNFKANEEIFKEQEEGPGKRFFHGIISFLSKAFICLPKKSSETKGQIFAKAINNFFTPKRSLGNSERSKEETRTKLDSALRA